MRTQTHLNDFISILINPYQEEITLNMTFHATGIITCESVGFIALGYRLLIFKHPQNRKQFLGFPCIFTDSF